MHAMFDFETMGQDPDTKVVSLGGVAFNREGVIGRKYWVFDWENQPDRTEDPDTAAWWARQKPEAREVFNTPKANRILLPDFVADLDAWLDSCAIDAGEVRDPKTGKLKELKPWGNGANFDIVILEDIIRQVHPKAKNGIPWAFWNVWCYRTFSAMTGCRDLIARNQLNTTVVKHNALADAEWQAMTVMEFWKLQDKRKAAKNGVKD